MSQLAIHPESNVIEIGNHSIPDLKARLNLTNGIIKMLRSSAEGDEDRTAKCLNRIIEQQHEINRRLVAAIKTQREQTGVEEPKPVSINLKPLSMGLRARR